MTPLSTRVAGARKPDNRLDCEIEIALFVPDETYASVRMNNAGTKLIYTRHDGRMETFRSMDHTLTAESRARAVTLLSALSSSQDSPI